MKAEPPLWSTDMRPPEARPMKMRLGVRNPHLLAIPQTWRAPPRPP